MSEVIEAEATEIAVTGDALPSNLFRTDNPAEVLQRAQETADALMPMVRSKGLVANIQGRDHLRVEAWTTLGAMLGVTPVCQWTRKLDNGWEARVEARTLDGRVIGAAEAECLRAESTWKDRDDYALRSMAQTRATSKALASVLRALVLTTATTVAGFGALGLAAHRGMQSFALVMVLGASGCLVAATLALPALMRVLWPDEGQPSASK